MYQIRIHTSIKFLLLFITIQLSLDLVAGGSGISDEDIKTVREDALKWHNIFRTWHKDTPPMALDEEMNKEAQAYAEELAEQGKFEHSKGGKDGENLYMVGGGDAKPTGEKSVKAWWAEYCDTKKWPRGDFNHFTQLVWKASTTLGIGVAKGETGVYVVGRYRKRGNINDEEGKRIKENVLPIICDESQVCNGLELRKPVKESGQCLAALGAGSRSGGQNGKGGRAGAGSGKQSGGARQGGGGDRHGAEHHSNANANKGGSLRLVFVLFGMILSRAAFTV